jgi:carbon storage regulator
MLVLTRKLNESIVINDNVSVLVVEIRGDRVRLGIDAPKDVIVHRQEIYNAINETDPTERSHKKSSAILAEPVA